MLIDNCNSLSIQHEIKTCIKGNNNNTQRNNNYSCNYMTNSNSICAPTHDFSRFSVFALSRPKLYLTPNINQQKNRDYIC